MTCDWHGSDNQKINMTTFNIWTHPTTGQVRVYLGGFGSTKVYAEEQAAEVFGNTIRLVAVNSNRNCSELGNIKNDAEQAINQAAGTRVKLFSALVALAK